MCCVPVSVVQLCVGGCVCLPVWDVSGSMCAHFSCSVCHGCSVYSATHLPYDKEDESGAQHQCQHVAEGRKGERHGCASQPDDKMGRERERELPPALYLFLAIAPSPSFLEVIVCFLSGPPSPHPMPAHPMPAESVSSRQVKHSVLVTINNQFELCFHSCLSLSRCMSGSKTT